jgi:hypothetical protein
VVEVGSARTGVDAVLRARRDPAPPGELECVMHLSISNAILVEWKVLVSRIVDDNELLLGIDAGDIGLVQEGTVHLLQLQKAEQLNVPSKVHGAAIVAGMMQPGW